MTKTPENDLLARLAGQGGPAGGPDPWAAVAASRPDHDREDQERDEKLDALIDRINQLGDKAAEDAADVPPKPDSPRDGEHLQNTYLPIEPESFRQADLTDSEVEALILKFLLARGDAAGRDIAEQVKLPFVLIDQLLRTMKNDQLIVHKGSAPMNDYQYQLTELGRERARRYSAYCTYFGAAPVSLQDYIASVEAQSLTRQHPTVADLRHAFKDLLLNQRMFGRLGPAINSGRGLFLYGAPGNGKTSIAERVTRAFGQHIWIPRTIGVGGEIIRLHDPANHEELPLDPNAGLIDQRKIDKRWIRVRRPTIIAGGELTMAALEVTVNRSTGIGEAPLQLKANCGTLVIDDFGRQRVRIEELLNRWILPLEKRYDFLNLPTGKKLQVPFDQLIIFSTNLEPRDLVDEAFLRRIPYKIEVVDPTEAEFRELFAMMAPQLGFEYRPETVDYLIEKHYRRTGRPFRCCHPRDLLLQVRSACAYNSRPFELTNEYLDMAVDIYFAVM
jgi:DNA-binding PadR family transcriptional regulator